jgi:hypothetical protein
MALDVERWVDSHVTSHEFDKVALEQIPPPPSFYELALLIPSLSAEMCVSPEQATHCHVLGF